MSLQHSFIDCLSEGMFGAITLVIDQVDRLLTEGQIADVVQLLAATMRLRPRVRVIFGCQTAEAERILSRLSQALERNEAHRTIFAPDEETMFQSVVERFPPLRNIAFRPELREGVLYTQKRRPARWPTERPRRVHRARYHQSEAVHRLVLAAVRPSRRRRHLSACF